MIRENSQECKPAKLLRTLSILGKEEFMGTAKFHSLRNQQVALQVELEAKKCNVFCRILSTPFSPTKQYTSEAVSAKCQHVFKNPLMRNYILGTRINIEKINRNNIESEIFLVVYIFSIDLLSYFSNEDLRAMNTR